MMSGKGSESGGGGASAAAATRTVDGHSEAGKGRLRHRRGHRHREGGTGSGALARAAAAEEGRVSNKETGAGTGGVTESQFRSFYGGLRAAMVESPGIYYMGVIDILQAFTLEKRMERFVKTYFLCQDPLGISAIEPRQYASRFRRRVVY